MMLFSFLVSFTRAVRPVLLLPIFFASSAPSSGLVFFFFKQKTAYEVRISDWSSDVCSSDLLARQVELVEPHPTLAQRRVPLVGRHRRQARPQQIGRASCRERVCQYA